MFFFVRGELRVIFFCLSAHFHNEENNNSNQSCICAGTKSENDSWQMKEYFIIRLQLDRLEFINYEDTKTLMQFSPPRCLLLLIAQ